MEAAVVLARDWRPLYFHTPVGRTAGSIPDTHSLWQALREHRPRLLGVAHSHPGGGIPGPSHEDLTTFASLEAELGLRLTWPIVTVDAVRAFSWRGPGRLDYRALEISFTVEMLGHWVPELLRLSQ